MPTVQQIIKQAKQANTPLAQTPLPLGANPSAFNYQQSWLTGAGRYGVPGMVATGNPADNASAKNFGNLASANYVAAYPPIPTYGQLLAAQPPPPTFEELHAQNPGRYPSPGVTVVGVGADPGVGSSGAFVPVGPGGSQPRGYSDVPSAENVIPEKDYLGVTPPPTGLAAVGAMNAFLAGPPETGGGYPGGLGPYGSFNYLMTGQIPNQNVSLTGTPQATGTMVGPDQLTAPTPTPSAPSVPYVTPQSTRETDPLGSLYDAFQRSLKQATLPASFSTTWGG